MYRFIYLYNYILGNKNYIMNQILQTIGLVFAATATLSMTYLITMVLCSSFKKSFNRSSLSNTDLSQLGDSIVEI